MLKIAAGVSYIAMVAVNFLANSVPINNRSTGDIADAYANLFTPAGFTFSIWGVIYLALAGYVLYQFIAPEPAHEKKNEAFFTRLNVLFIGTSLANISWIFAWHYDRIGLSVCIMGILLFLLIKIADLLRTTHINTWEKICIATPFSIYFGWITVATIANITVFLVSIGWDGFGIPEHVWTGIILLVGAGIGIARMQKDKNSAYGLVLIWAYAGILYKHLSASGFDAHYPNIIATIIICLFLFMIYTGRTFIKNNYRVI